MPVKPRVKGEESLLQKAFYRNKNYVDPYEEIEDKVGLRFVVLLVEDIRTIEAAIVSYGGWDAKKARDFIDEQDERPYEFDYQSVHYVLRSSFPLTYGEVEIPANIACEVQIRTLLQHAYSELTHDTIYKPSVQASPAVKRAAAKSMALIEATSDYFSNVHGVIQAAVVRGEKLAMFLAEKYQEWIGFPSTVTPLNSLVVDHYKDLLPDNFDSDFDRWMKDKPFVRDIIAERLNDQALYRIPSILLVYYCVSKTPQRAKENSPLTDGELAPIYSDLGKAMVG
jgi:putative GTP pyrophosphokinase